MIEAVIKRYQKYFYVDFNIGNFYKHANADKIISEFYNVPYEDYYLELIKHNSKCVVIDKKIYYMFKTKYMANKFLDKIKSMGVWHTLQGREKNDMLPVEFYEYDETTRQKLIGWLSAFLLELKHTTITDSTLRNNFYNVFEIEISRGAIRGAMMELGYEIDIKNKICFFNMVYNYG